MWQAQQNSLLKHEINEVEKLLIGFRNTLNEAEEKVEESYERSDCLNADIALRLS